MPALLSEFGLDGMRDVAIEEWQAASHYTRRMKEALSITGDGVAEIFKGFQLDVGAPPEFMDFRYGVTDHGTGEFWLDHCGALMDVEPMGERITKTMCHDIEDPTFPATALATNPRAQVVPIHRPPRDPEGRTPHCHWKVWIDPEAEPAPLPEPAVESATSRLIDFGSPLPRRAPPAGERTTRGPLLTDLVFSEFTSAALIRIIREVYLQMHLLAVGFHQSVRRRSDRRPPTGCSPTRPPGSPRSQADGCARSSASTATPAGLAGPRRAPCPGRSPPPALSRGPPTTAHSSSRGTPRRRFPRARGCHCSPPLTFAC